MDYFKEGYRMAELGYSHRVCPYHKIYNYKQWRAWMAGWCDYNALAFSP